MEMNDLNEKRPTVPADEFWEYNQNARAIGKRVVRRICRRTASKPRVPFEQSFPLCQLVERRGYRVNQLPVNAGSNLSRNLSLRLTDKLIELLFDERRDAFAILPECCVESLFGLVVEIVGPAKDGVFGDLWVVHTDHSE